MSCELLTSIMPLTRRVPAGTPDLTGQRRGALTVVGYFGPGRNSKGGSRWIVRCECGLYSIRRGRTIKRKNMDDYCSACGRDKADFVRAFMRQHGRRPDYWELPA